ncbi:MAG: aminotransferase [Paracoccaceae bacterium]
MTTRTQSTFASPISESRGWLNGVTFTPDRPLLNLSQAAPVAMPPPDMLAAMAGALQDPATHLYGPDLGLPALRAALAARTAQIYGGALHHDQVAITAGANQAFATAIATLCGEGDEVLLPTPWYFNHKMWLDMSGVRAVPLPSLAGLLPDVDAAAHLITARTRAIVLVTPNNPTGAEYPPNLIRAFRDLARRHGIALILDETYRDFHSHEHTLNGAPHDLFLDPDWDDTLVHLYSFSKSYRLTGHRIGAMIASPERLYQGEKFIDASTICPNQLGQRAALWGLENLDDWLAQERREILHRRAAITGGFAQLHAQGWHLLGCGAYFAYVQHPFDLPSNLLAQQLVKQAAVLALPATMFTPDHDPAGARQMRLAFANIDAAGIGHLFDRLSDIALPLAPAPSTP